jgi:phosphotransferase system enzyme I (PtsI)
MPDKENSIWLRGRTLAPGLAIGRLHLYEKSQPPVLRYEVQDRIEEEIFRYHRALAACREEIEKARSLLIKSADECDASGSRDLIEIQEAQSILDAHCEILSDPLLLQDVIQEIRQSHVNASHALDKVFQQYLDKTAEIDNEFFFSRLKELVELSKRIQSFLTKLYQGDHYPLEIHPKTTSKPHESFSNVKAVILYIPEATPALIAQLGKEVVGLLVEHTGVRSHAAIIARAKGIPMVGGVSLEIARQAEGRELFLDGYQSLVCAPPTKEQRHQWMTWCMERETKNQLPIDKKILDPTEPRKVPGSFPLKLMCNIALQQEVEALRDESLDGVGLVRTESLFWEYNSFPTMEEQYCVYRRLIQAAKGKVVTIRLFDLGGDKMPLFFGKAPKKACPVGSTAENQYRSIQYLLYHRTYLKDQLKAILLAAKDGPVRILIPMVISLEQVREVKESLKQCYNELLELNSKVDEIPIGAMIELPGAMIIADLLSKEVQFFSVGTNDLVQYTLGIDRNMETEERCLGEFHPAIMRQLCHIGRVSKDNQIPFMVCGEMAAEPLFYPFLCDIGCDGISVALPAVAKLFENIQRGGGAFVGLSELLSAQEDSAEVKRILEEYECSCLKS